MVLTGFSWVQFSRSVDFDSLQCHEPQHIRPPCPSPNPEFTQTHVHWVGVAIQPSHPLLSSSPPALNLSQHQGLFQWVSCFCIRWPKYWSFSISLSKEYSGKSDFLSDLPVRSPCSPRDSHESSPTPQVKSISYTKCGMRLRRIPNRGRTCVLAVN